VPGDPFAAIASSSPALAADQAAVEAELAARSPDRAASPR